MAEIRTIQTSEPGRLLLAEDPYPDQNRLFIDTVQYDLTTLTPTWNKQYQWLANGIFEYGTTNTATLSFGSFTPAGTIDNLNQYGVMFLQKQTISCYGPQWGYAGGIVKLGAYDTFHQTMDFLNYPASKWKKLGSNNAAVLLQPYRSQSGAHENVGYCYYGATPQDITTANPYRISTNMLSNIFWEDTANNTLWGVRFSSHHNVALFSAWGYAGTYNSSSHVSTSTGQLFFMGVDRANAVYYLEARDSANGTPYYVYKCSTNTAQAGNVYSLLSDVKPFRANGSANTLPHRRTYPSNIRRDSSNVNRYVFYSSHYDNGGFSANTVGDVNANLTPLRFVFDINTGNVNYDQCNVAYPGTNTWANYAQAIVNTGINYTETASGYNPWMVKPYQFVSNGNNYITFWIADSSAQLSASQGSSAKWRNPNTRTMMTYTMPTGQTDNNLTYHSSYTFPTLADIPWNYMPLNLKETGPYSNSTLMVVPSTGKTSFMKWNDTAGWSVCSVYPVEARGIGLDSTDRLWIMGMEKNNGTLHILSNTIPVNVSVTLANTDTLIYTGNTISTYAIVNAWNYGGDRVSSNVTLSIDGNTMLIANNSGRTYTVTTSATTDTIIGLTVSGGGINNMYATISV